VQDGWADQLRRSRKRACSVIPNLHARCCKKLCKLLTDDVAVARSLIRDVIKGSMGYAELSRRTGTPEKSLVRMFGTNGNPTAANFFAVLTHLQQYSGVTFQVAAVRSPARKRSGRISE
jgi:DNA-binding phage protein